MQGRTKAPALLLVDDSDLDRELLASYLSEEGFRIFEADRGSDVDALIANNDIDLVLLDVVLPDINGLTVLRSIRETIPAAALPVIMLTARGSKDDVVEGLSQGANDYLAKPIDIDVLLARVKTQVLLKEAKEALRESEERYALAVLGANDGIWDWDLRNNDIYLSTRWKALLGYEDHDIDDSVETWFGRVHPEDLARVKELIRLHIEGASDHLEMEYRMMTASGRFHWVLTRGIAIRDRAGKAYRMAGSQTDITGNKLTDALTGLPNKILFLDRTSHAIKRLHRSSTSSFVVCTIDIDRFNLVNESMGHLAGDTLLKLFAERLSEGLRPEDTLARFGGDEFALLLEGVKGNDDAFRFVDRIRAKMALPFEVNGREIFVSFGLGLALGLRSYQNSEELIRDANTALHRAKLRGTSNFELFDSAMHVRVLKRFQVEGDLRRAIEKDEMFLSYQPIVAATGDSNIGYEALVRWRSPSQELPIAPSEFIPIAEETGLIVPLGAWVFRTACRNMRDFNLKSKSRYSVSVNFSARQFQQNNVVSLISDIVRETGFDPSLVKLELTESVLLDNADDAVHKLRRFRDMGMGISIDDFGTGYSSLSYLTQFPITTLKIDQSFVRDLAVSSGAANIVRAIIALAHNLSLDVVAEGVETPDQYRFLREHGCEAMQGFLFGRPVAVEEMTTFQGDSRLVEFG